MNRPRRALETVSAREGELSLTADRVRRRGARTVARLRAAARERPSVRCIGFLALGAAAAAWAWLPITLIRFYRTVPHPDRRPPDRRTAVAG
jgi:hypothetical protein